MIVEALKRLRKARGMTLAEVAKNCGLHPEAVARAERAGVDPRFSTVVAIADAIGAPLCQVHDKATKHERHRKRPRKA